MCTVALYHMTVPFTRGIRRHPHPSHPPNSAFVLFSGVPDPACCALCGRPLDADRAPWVVLDEGLGFRVCPSLEDCPPLRAIVRECPDRFEYGLTRPKPERPVRL